MDNLCRNCGHGRRFHFAWADLRSGDLDFKPIDCDFETGDGLCGCKLFQPKEEKTPEEIRFENALADYWDRRSGACEEES
jgi:hypothetical protein